jgi:hypothetical protein
MRPALLKAYRETCYEARGVEIRIGCHSAAMDELLLSRGAREAVFITAYNPFSRAKPSGWNRRMQTQLAEALRRRPMLTGKGSWRGWCEAHFLMLGDTRPALRIARRFRQYGIVTIRIRQPARLLVASRLA